MKVAVIAAGGRTGRLVVEELLRDGHAVRAGVHRHLPFGEAGSDAERPAEHQPSSEDGRVGLEIVRCDATNLDDLATLIAGCDAAVSMIGHGLKSPADLQTHATLNLVRAARRTGLRRIVSLTGSGVQFPGDRLTTSDRLLNWGMNLALGFVVRDGTSHAEVLKKSGLDWTIIRALVLTKGRPGRFSLKPHGPAKTFTPRAEVAQAVRQVLESGSFIRQAPVMGAGVPEPPSPSPAE